MKKGKRILAICGIILLALLYLSTIIAALFEPDGTIGFLMASVVATIIVPVLIWAYGLFARLLRRGTETFRDESAEDEAVSEAEADPTDDGSAEGDKQ